MNHMPAHSRLGSLTPPKLNISTKAPTRPKDLQMIKTLQKNIPKPISIINTDSLYDKRPYAT